MPKETSRRSVDSLCHGSRDIHKETSRRSVDSLCHGKQRQTKADLEEICEFLVLREVDKYLRRPRGDMWIPCDGKQRHTKGNLEEIR